MDLLRWGEVTVARTFETVGFGAIWSVQCARSMFVACAAEVQSWGKVMATTLVCSALGLSCSCVVVVQFTEAGKSWGRRESLDHPIKLPGINNLTSMAL